MQNLKDILQEVIDNLPDSNNILLQDLYVGGVVSIIGKGIYKTDVEEIPVAIKFTHDNIKLNSVFSPLESRNLLLHAATTHSLDATLLSELNKMGLNVPEVIKYYPEARVTVMKDFNSQGYALLQTKLVKDPQSIPIEAFRNIGISLAKSIDYFRSLPDSIRGVEDKILQIEERTDELRVSLYNRRMDSYNSIWERLLSEEHKSLVWTDGHPKNMAFNDAGEVMFFDFGRSINIDPEYILPNFLAHLYLSVLGGALPTKLGFRFIKETIDAFRSEINVEFDQVQAIKYLVAEIAHRGKTMRWIDPNLINIPELSMEEAEGRVKAAVDHIIDLAFGGVIKDYEAFDKIFTQILAHVRDNRNVYARPVLQI